MAISRGTARSYQVAMAVVCTMLASGGFVGAGYVGTSSADAAAALSAQESVRVLPAAHVAHMNELGSFAAQSLGMRMSFADTLIRAKKPAAKQVFDLTDPTVDTPRLIHAIDATRGVIPEVSAELISQVRKDILAAAYQGIGHSYVWGGTSFEYGWDCSGFVQWAYAQAGVGLPRTEQWMPMVETVNPQPGDIVVQNPDGPYHWSHIGIYIGNGKMISALNPSVGTFMHAPEDVSSSSAYFTMPAFATADELAKQRAAKNESNLKSAGRTASSSGTASSSSTASSSRTPSTSSATPAAKPASTVPSTMPPETSGAPMTPPATTPAVATDPARTPPVTSVPETTPPVTESHRALAPQSQAPSAETGQSSADPEVVPPESATSNRAAPLVTPEG